MTKLIGIKELQTNTKRIREQVAKGTRFIVVYRSKPIFEIKPLEDENFYDDLKGAGVYKDEFLDNMAEAREDIKSGRVKEYSTDDFLNSLKKG